MIWLGLQQMKWIDVLRESNRIMENSNEIWVFLSHSNKDYEKVRQVRNLLEEQGFRPLMFFLNCLNDDDEVESLIKREIDSRQRFVLCDSTNAQNSKWVQEEISYIKSRNRLWERIDLDNSIDDICKALARFKSRNTIYINNVPDDQKLVNSIVSYLQSKEYLVVNKYDYNNDCDVLSSGYFINIFSSNVLKNGNTPIFVMNYNKFLTLDYQTEDTAIINIFIDPRKELLERYYQDPGVDKYEGIFAKTNKMIDFDLSGKESDDIPHLIYNYIWNLDRKLNEIFDRAKQCVRGNEEIMAMRGCLNARNVKLDAPSLQKYGFSYHNHNNYTNHDATNIVRSTAMYELACNHLVGASCKKSFNIAIKYFYEASKLGMKNAQKVLYHLGTAFLSHEIITFIEEDTYTSSDGFIEYLRAKCIESGQSYAEEHDAIFHLYEYSEGKGCYFGREELQKFYKLPEHLNEERYLNLARICENCWYEFCFLEYPSKINWEKLFKDISK